MDAAHASEMLERFAAGAATAEVCTPGGRALLRGAVRSYGAELAEAGVEWPVAPTAEADPFTLKRMDVSVVMALSAGMLEVSDFSGPVRQLLADGSFVAPQMGNLHGAARVACPQVIDMSRAAAQFVMEQARSNAFADMGGVRAERQRVRLARAQTEYESSAADVVAAVEAART